MSAKTHNAALVFAALGDETRLGLVTKLSRGKPHSISELAKSSPLTRQAITKHLRVLQGAGVVQSVRQGRESLFELNPAALTLSEAYLAEISAQWEDALGRLKAFVED